MCPVLLEYFPYHKSHICILCKFYMQTTAGLQKKKKTISSESDCLWCQSVEQHFLSFKMQTIPNFCFNILSILWTFLDAFPTAPSYLFSPSLCFSYCVACLVLEFVLGVDFTLGRFWSKRFCWVFLLCRGRMKSSPWGCQSQNWKLLFHGVLWAKLMSFVVKEKKRSARL